MNIQVDMESRGVTPHSPSRSTLYGVSTPSTSPTRIRALSAQGLINENSIPYQSAMEKIAAASRRFDRSKDDSLLKTLDNRELLPEQFRQMLRSGMDCKLSHDEFAAVRPLFDNRGLIDGSEFILLFYRLRYEMRAKELTERVQYEKRNREELKIQQEKRRQEMGARKQLDMVDDYTPDDLKSAIHKLREGAVRYDKYMPGSTPIDAFNVYSMNTAEFAEHLKKVFQVQLSIKELSAFLNDFNRSREDRSTIYCAGFLVHFFRMGFEEKSRRLHAVWDEKKRIQEEQERKRRLEEKEQGKKNAAQINRNFTEEDKERAIFKLRNAARLYDKTTPGAMSMKAFEVKEMPPHIFKEQLRRIFNLQLSPVEMGAIMSVFDVNGDGVITCEEFTKVFINMGFEEREKELKASIERQKRYERLRQEELDLKAQELAQKNSMKVSYEYSEAEYASAMEKLMDAAWRYDKTMPGAPALDAFEAKTMEPHVFKEQLRRAFYMKVTPQELGAIMHYFDKDRTGRIVCADFLKKFFKTGFEERQRRKAQWREHQKTLIAQRLEEDKQKLEALSKKTNLVNASTSRDFTETDFQSAMAKLTHAAFKYDRTLPGAAGLNAFECISMPPHVFREQLKLVFHLKVTLPELWALVSFYDKTGSGEICCRDFIAQFLSTGFAERDRIQQRWRAEKMHKAQLDKELQRIKDEETRKKAWSEVDFDFLEADFDSALHKLIMLGFNFDRRQLGPQGLKFDVETWNPAEFKEMLKRTFSLKVTPRELGALVNYFDTLQNKTAHVSTFLNTFTHIRVDCEDFKGKRHEQERLQEYEAQLKAEYQHRIAKNSSVDARPWRQNSTLTIQKGLRAIYKPARDPKLLNNATGAVGGSGNHTLYQGPPQDPLAKFKLRVLVGRRTGRMDLACKQVWTTSSSAMSNSSSQGGHAHGRGAKLNKKKKAKADTADGEQKAVVTEDEGEGEDGGDDEQSVSSALSAVSPQHPHHTPANQAGLSLSLSAVTSKDEGGGESADKEKSESEEPGGELKHADEDREARNEEEEAMILFADMALHTARSAEDDSVASVDAPVTSSATLLPEIEFRLHSAPPEILKMTELRELWLCNHCIVTLPETIGNLQQLQVLSLQGNRLDSLPAAICQLHNLRRLYVQRNRLSSLPNRFAQLSSLHDLQLSHNNFTQFPEVVTGLRQLQTLDISHNQLHDLPMALRHLRSLVLLQLDGNPFSTVDDPHHNHHNHSTGSLPSPSSPGTRSTFNLTQGYQQHSSSQYQAAAVTTHKPPVVLQHLSWVHVAGLPRDLQPVGERAVHSFAIAPAEDFELSGLLKSRAVTAQAHKLHPRRRRNNYIV